MGCNNEFGSDAFYRLGAVNAPLKRLRTNGYPLITVVVKYFRNGGHQHLYQSDCVFVGFFEATDVVCRLTPSPAERLWYEFTEWMRAQRGSMNSMLTSYSLPIAALLQSVGTDPRAFTAERLRHFLLQQVKQSSRVQSRNLATALRIFLRFLIARGDCATGLDYAIPTAARWRLAVA